jgi:hypothetical protein
MSRAVAGDETDAEVAAAAELASLQLLSIGEEAAALAKGVAPLLRAAEARSIAITAEREEEQRRVFGEFLRLSDDLKEKGNALFTVS